MTQTVRSTLAGILIGLLGGEVAAQQTGGIGTGGLGAGTGTGTGGLSSGTAGLGTGGLGSGGGLGGGGLGTGNSSTFQLQQLMQAPTIAPPTTTTGASTGVSSSNFLAPYYSNVFYQGSAQNNRSTGGTAGAPGGFGQPTFGANGGLGGGSIGFAGSTGSSRGGSIGSSRGGTMGGGRGGGIGGIGTGGFGGLGGLGTTNLQSGVVIPQQTGNSYMMVARFSSQTTPAPQLQQQIQNLLQRSTNISNPGSIQATVSGRMVILRGTVADEEEARRIANLVSLTPGVYEVRNELTYPKLPVLDR